MQRAWKENLRPSQSESKRRVAVSRSITSETGTQRHPSCHFTETSHNYEDEKADKRVRDEQRAGSSLRKSLASSDNETSSKGTTNGNHGNVTSLEALVKHRLGRSLYTANLNILILVVSNAGLFRIASIVTFARAGIDAF